MVVVAWRYTLKEKYEWYLLEQATRSNDISQWYNIVCFCIKLIYVGIKLVYTLKKMCLFGVAPILF